MTNGAVSKLSATLQFRENHSNTLGNFSRVANASQLAQSHLACADVAKGFVLAVALRIYLAMIRILTYLAWACSSWCCGCWSLSTRDRVWHSVLLWVSAISRPVRSWLSVHRCAGSVLRVTVLHIVLGWVGRVLLAALLRVGWARRSN